MRLFGAIIALVLPQVKGNAVRPIAMSTLEPSPSAPDIPTMAATVPGFEASAWHGVFLPAAAPAPIAAKLNAEVREFLSKDDTKAKFFEVGAVPAPMSPGNSRLSSRSSGRNGPTW